MVSNVHTVSFEAAMAMAMVAVLAALTIVVQAMGSSAPAAATPPNCDSAASALFPCYAYVTGPDEKPPSECCAGMESVNSNPTCVCELITQLNSTTVSDPSINLTKAFNLPRDCSITLNAHNCPALADLILHPPKGVLVSPAPAPTSTSGPTPEAHVPATAMQQYNVASRLDSTNFVLILGVTAAAVAVQTFLH